MSGPPDPAQALKSRLREARNGGSVLTVVGAFSLTLAIFAGIYSTAGNAVSLAAIGVLAFVPGVGLLLFASLLPMLVQPNPLPTPPRRPETEADPARPE